LARLLNDEDKSIRTEAAIALLHMGDSTDQVRQNIESALKDDSNIFRPLSLITYASLTLNDFPPAVIPIFRKMLQSRDADIRDIAALMLAKFGKRSIEAKSDLVLMLRSRVQKKVGSNTLPPSAIVALGELGAEAKDAVAEIEPWLENADQTTAAMAATAILAIDSAHERAFAYAKKQIETAGARNRSTIMVGIWSNPAVGVRLIPTVASAFRDVSTSTYDREMCIRFFENLGPAAKSAATLMEEELRNGDPNMRINAAIALVKIEKSAWPKVAPVFREAIEGKNHDAAGKAAKHLMANPPADQESRRFLTSGLKHESTVVACDCAVAILRIDANDRTASAFLQKMLKQGESGEENGFIDMNMLSRAVAAEAIAELRSGGKPFRSAILDLLRSDDGNATQASARTLRIMDVK
jgi:hypothetical protein